MEAKRFLEYRIRREQEFIEINERDFNELVASRNRNYGAIIQSALTIKSLQDKLKGMQEALDTMDVCEDQMEGTEEN